MTQTLSSGSTSIAITAPKIPALGKGRFGQVGSYSKIGTPSSDPAISAAGAVPSSTGGEAHAPKATRAAIATARVMLVCLIAKSPVEKGVLGASCSSPSAIRR